MKQFLEKLSLHQPLSTIEINEAAAAIFAEHTTETEIAAFLMALKSKGETATEIAGLVDVLRQQALPIHTQARNIMDNCGTGGDGSQSFNISSTAAFVLAGAGITVAKHGSRSVSSKTGSADVLEELGINIYLETAQIEESLSEIGISFLFAPSIQPNLGRITRIRKELKIPTVFNLIGPLTNPVNLQSQLIGVYRSDMLELFANVLKKLGRKRAVAVTGAGNMDEASLQGENKIVLLNEGDITSFTLHPEEVNLPLYTNDKIRGGSAHENAAIMMSVLKNEKGPYRDTVLLNAGLGVFANGKAPTILEGINTARESLESGRALAKLEALISYCQKKKVVM